MQREGQRDLLVIGNDLEKRQQAVLRLAAMLEAKSREPSRSLGVSTQVLGPIAESSRMDRKWP